MFSRLHTHNRTKKVALTSASSFLSYGSNLFIGIIVTPVIVKFLGLDQYGIWMMLGQLFGYISLVDICPTRVLKLTLASEQHSLDDGMKRRQVGAALVIAFLILPLFIVSGVLAVWLFPLLFKIDAHLINIVIWVIIIMTFDAALRNFTSIPSSILRAMNIDYAAMGVSTFVTIITGLLNIVVVLAGWGLIGLAINTFFASVVASGIRLYIVLKRIPWFGIEMPSKVEIKLLLKRSAYFTSDAVTSTLGQRSENLIIGGILGTSAVAIYTLTKTFGRVLFEIISQLFSSANSGIADIAGQKNFELMMHIRSHMIKIAIVASMSTSVLVFLWNRSFVAIWVGLDKYGGIVVTLLIVLLLSFKLLVSVNRSFMGALLLIKEDSVSASIKNVIVFILMLFAAYYAGLSGILGAMIIGEIGLLIYISRILAKYIQLKEISFSRVFLSVGILAVISLLIRTSADVLSWLGLCNGIFLSYLVCIFLMVVIIFNKTDYRFWLKRVNIVLGR